MFIQPLIHSKYIFLFKKMTIPEKFCTVLQKLLYPILLSGVVPNSTYAKDFCLNMCISCYEYINDVPLLSTFCYKVMMRNITNAHGLKSFIAKISTVPCLPRRKRQYNRKPRGTSPEFLFHFFPINSFRI